MKQINRKCLSKFLKRIRKNTTTGEVDDEDYESDSSDVSRGDRKQETDE